MGPQRKLTNRLWLVGIAALLALAPARLVAQGPDNQGQGPHIAVLGAGHYGTALALHLARRGFPVRLWTRSGHVLNSIVNDPRNELALEIEKERTTDQGKTRWESGVLRDGRSGAKVRLKRDIEAVVPGADLVLVATPSGHVERIAQAMAPHLSRGTTVVSVAKGLENAGRGFSPMTDVIRRTVPEDKRDGIAFAALSGPSFAKEIIARRPTVVTVAAENPEVAERVAGRFDLPGVFHVERSVDLRGIQFWGAAKNSVALLAGLLDGAKANRRTRARAISAAIRELAQIGQHWASRWGVVLSPETFASAAGIGDLWLTCSDGSRNYKMGLALGAKQTMHEIKQKMNGQVAEGVDATHALLAIAQNAIVSADRAGLDVPVLSALGSVLQDDLAPEALRDKLKQALKPQREGNRFRQRLGTLHGELAVGIARGRGATYNEQATVLMRVIEKMGLEPGAPKLLQRPGLGKLVLTNGKRRRGLVFAVGRAWGWSTARGAALSRRVAGAIKGGHESRRRRAWAWATR